jgi:propanol-preferring alcohol dehydrogenase
MGPGLGRDGGMAQRLLVPSDRYLVPLGDLDPVEAAPLTDAGLTPYHAVKRALPLLVPGSTAVVIGVGGLGHMAVQLLRELSPATIIAVDQRADALARATDGGADHAVLSGEGSDAVAEIRAQTRDKGAELVIDVVGADATLALAAAVARPLGHITIMGIAGGTLPINFFGIGYEVSVATTYWGSMPELIEVVALAAAGRIRPHIQRFSLAEAGAAYQAMHDGTLDGRAVIVPAEN